MECAQRNPAPAGRKCVGRLRPKVGPVRAPSKVLGEGGLGEGDLFQKVPSPNCLAFAFTLRFVASLVLALAFAVNCLAAAEGWYFPPPGESLEQQDRRAPDAVGLKPAIVEQLQGTGSRWALWRHGYLVHVEGDWNKKQDVASLRKTWHALTVGAAIGQGKIPNYHQLVRTWYPDLNGRDASATWWHVITQSSGFDYPHPDYPDVGDPAPGAVWTYTDKNPRVLCNALARLYGKTDFRDNYEDIAKQAFFDAIDMRGWEARTNQDGIRFHLDLEDMGRLGLLVLARGRWADKQVVPRWFVEELERKQTYGMKPVYNGPDDGNVGGGWWHERRDQYPECPYGYMTWVNTDGELYRGADRAWAYGAGAGGTRIMWNHKFGTVYAAVGVDEKPTDNGIAHIIERNIAGPNPLVKPEPQFEPSKVARGAYPDIAVDKAGNVHLVYVRDDALYYRRLDALAGRWSEETSTGLPAGSANRSDPEIVIDSKGRPHMLVGTRYAWLDGDKWDAIDPGVVRDTAMAIDSKDNVYIVRRGGKNGGYIGLRKRAAGAAEFVSMPDPDTAGGLSLGRNDHVYSHVFVSPADDSIHIVYRHGAPTNCAYRTSSDGGRTWRGAGISNDDYEAPSGAAAPDGTLYAISGSGTVYKRERSADDWQKLGRAVTTFKRDLPVIVAGAKGDLFAAAFGGRINAYASGQWIGERLLPSASSQPFGFVDLAAGPDGSIFAAWEEGRMVSNDEPAGTSDILVARITTAWLKGVSD